MTDLLNTPDEELLVPDELSELKARADLLGIKYHPNIGVDSLRERVNATVTGEEQAPEAAEIPEPSALEQESVVINSVSVAQLKEAVASVRIVDANETPAQRKFRRRAEGRRLVRVNVMNMNPFRKDWEGDTYCVGNGTIGTIKRFVPYNVDWHVEQALLDVMQERKCQVFTSRKDPRTGQEVKSARTIKELQIAILPPLTEKELKDLAQRQAMAAGTQAED